MIEEDKLIKYVTALKILNKCHLGNILHPTINQVIIFLPFYSVMLWVVNFDVFSKIWDSYDETIR